MSKMFGEGGQLDEGVKMARAWLSIIGVICLAYVINEGLNGRNPVGDWIGDTVHDVRVWYHRKKAELPQLAADIKADKEFAEKAKAGHDAFLQTERGKARAARFAALGLDPEKQDHKAVAALGKALNVDGYLGRNESMEDVLTRMEKAQADAYARMTALGIQFEHDTPPSAAAKVLGAVGFDLHTNSYKALDAFAADIGIIAFRDEPFYKLLARTEKRKADMAKPPVTIVYDLKMPTIK